MKDIPMPERHMLSRRKMLGGAGAITVAAAAASVSKVAMAALPEPVMQTKPDTMPPLVPNTGRPYNPVVTLNGWTLPWRLGASRTRIDVARATSARRRARSPSCR